MFLGHYSIKGKEFISSTYSFYDDNDDDYADNDDATWLSCGGGVPFTYIRQHRSRAVVDLALYQRGNRRYYCAAGRTRPG